MYGFLQTPGGYSARDRHVGDQSHQIANAIASLRANYAKRLRVEDLASRADMGTSTLRHNFCALIAMSPLQNQKQLRLVVERMPIERIDATVAVTEPTLPVSSAKVRRLPRSWETTISSRPASSRSFRLLYRNRCSSR